MSCVFTVAVAPETDVKELIEKGKKAFANMDGSFNGNEEKGEFYLDTPLGKIAGNYEISGGEMKVELSEKPMMLPCSLVEGEFRKYLNE